MFDYHGWVTLRDHATADDGVTLADATLKAVQGLLRSADLNNDFQTADVRAANGFWHVWLAGCRNHRNEPVLAAWRTLAQLAPGSYGVLYVQDDEDPEHDNHWLQHIMARGGLKVRRDKYLSPVVPVLQDPEP